MSPNQLEQFLSLRDAGVFDELFDEAEEQMVSEWKRTEDTAKREALWNRQRALRDLRRQFNKPREVAA